MAKRLFRLLHVLHKIIGAVIGRGIARRQHRIEAGPHGGEILPEDLAGIARLNGRTIAGGLKQVRQVFAEMPGDVCFLRRHRDELRKLGQTAVKAFHRRFAVFAERQPRRRRGHEGVAIAIAADPRRKFQRRANLEGMFGVMALERVFKEFGHLRCALEEDVLEEMQAPADFLFHCWLFQADFAGEPEEVDIILERPDDALAFARGPARAFKIIQFQINAPVDFQHRDALGLRWMGRDGGADIGVRQGLFHGLRRNAGGGDDRYGIGERSHDLIKPAMGFQPPPRPHGAVLFRDIEELQPDAGHLQGGRYEVRREGRSLRRIIQHGGHMGLADADHLAQKIAQENGDFIDVTAIDRLRLLRA